MVSCRFVKGLRTSNVKRKTTDTHVTTRANELHSKPDKITANPSVSSLPTNAIRHERLKFMYDKLLQLIIHEGRFVSERTNALLVVNTIFLTGFVVLLTQNPSTDNWMLGLQIYIPVIGIFISATHSVLMARTTIRHYASGVHQQKYASL